MYTKYLDTLRHGPSIKRLRGASREEYGHSAVYYTIGDWDHLSTVIALCPLMNIILKMGD